MIASHPYYAGIEQALRDASGSPGAPVLTGHRLFADQLADDAELPAVRYALLNDTPDQRLASGDSTTADLQIDVYADRGDTLAAWTLDRVIRSALDRKTITVDGFAGVMCQCMMRGQPMPEPGFYRITSEYRLFGSRA